MVVCVVVYLLLFWVYGKCKTETWKKKIWLVLVVSNTLALLLFLAGSFGDSEPGSILRNDYGKGSKVEQYEASIEGELDREPIEIEVGERAYTAEETQEMFSKIMEELDKIVPGENQSKDHVEKDLCLPDKVEGYPATIRWELDNYQVLDTEGRILPEGTTPEGTLVEVKGFLSYKEWEAVYVTDVMVYPETKTGKEKWISDLQEKVRKNEERTREQGEFTLPETLQGKNIQWRKKADNRGYLVLVFGIILSGLLVWNRKQEEKDERERRFAQMERDYPNIVSKIVMLLDTGMTMKQVWEKLVLQYEQRRGEGDRRAAYEEMVQTYHEMQSGITETEAYERFGMRCGSAPYLKLSALLSQNVRKGSRGLSELLRVDAIQAFENRKSNAKRRGEEAGTKLMLPMIGMLAVVLIMVVVPAFLSMRL